MTATPDFIVIAAAELVRRKAGTVLLIEAGPSDRSPLVSMLFGLVWMIGSARRDWRYSSAPKKNLGGRRLNVTRGRMVGGSGSINSMVWFRGRRRSSADGFIKPAPAGLTVAIGQEVDRILFDGDTSRGVRLVDGSELGTHKGVVLSAGAIGSPSTLMRSSIGPRADLERLGIDVRRDAEEVGANPHDYPAVPLQFSGPGSGYRLTPSQVPSWALAPFQYLITHRGRSASPTVEGGGFFNARGLDEAPDVEKHFIPFMLGWKGKCYVYDTGYFADDCVCRPKSRGALRLASSDSQASPDIDLGLFSDNSDLETLVAGLKRLRALMEQADFGTRRAPKAFPGLSVQSEKVRRAHVRDRGATAYHPVGTLRMGEGAAPVAPRLSVRGVEGPWVADASIMPAVTSANTNAPSMMIGYRAGELISEDCA